MRGLAFTCEGAETYTGWDEIEIAASIAGQAGLRLQGLSTGMIDETIRETGRAVAPLGDEMVREIAQAALLHADETHERGVAGYSP